MSTGDQFRRMVAEAKRSHTYWAGKAKLDFAVALNDIMEAEGISRQELAERIGTSPAYITKVMRGDSNFTVDTMAKLAHAVSGHLCLRVVKKHDQVSWSGIVDHKRMKERFRTWIPAPEVSVAGHKPKVQRNEKAPAAA